ncbi:hypothetical protein EFK68_04140 [Pseudomonas aeruginosa]|uniref:hypothetical protein n=1 Tax=Pseudomonas aeruginosa TaxID=287 RepID=UPI000F6B226E|nr:hypothetical protein [Pseudomonas aeruginosa]EKF7417622.1 hypothetical protein [Pseudomonas aeruginosa]MDS9914816.1 hypothetical protein [Pseudomonas aeruginosa]RNF58562.1 hypothetical protein EFK68_04140 [Pseudomonas aeruginosa]HBO1620022.1 hypothetical protein [Pseudomonas aeruginosa]
MQKTTKFPEAALQTWPYLQPMSFRSRSEIEDFARQQQKLAGKSQKLFQERLDKLKSDGGSIRSYPTPSLDVRDECVVDLGLLKAMARGVANSAVKVTSEPVAVVPKVESDVPPEFDQTLVHDEMYAGVEIEPECDKTIPVGPEGEAAQPQVIDWSDAFTGEISFYGKYAYLFKPENQKKKPSYVIRLGTKDHWGVDLERIMKEHKFKKGDRIALKCIGMMPVTIEEVGYDNQGNEEVILRPGKRKTWVAKRIG